MPAVSCVICLCSAILNQHVLFKKPLEFVRRARARAAVGGQSGNFRTGKAVKGSVFYGNIYGFVIFGECRLLIN